jgi:hypothetical protein
VIRTTAAPRDSKSAHSTRRASASGSQEFPKGIADCEGMRRGVATQLGERRGKRRAPRHVCLGHAEFCPEGQAALTHDCCALR